MRYRQTLPIGERHLVGRLESFGDIVMGFSMSQLALQLEIPKRPEDVFAHPMNYFVFFAAFGLLAMFWLRFHRIMAIGFAPRRVDLALLFGMLSFIALVPFALITYTRLLGPQGSFSQQSVSLYLGVFLGISVFSWALNIRGLRRAWPVLETDEERNDAWRPVLAGAVLVPTFAIALAGVLTAGPYAFGLLLLMAPLIRVARRLAPRPPAFVLPARSAAPVGTLEPAAES
jgi:uncharacterized membrane protein